MLKSEGKREQIVALLKASKDESGRIDIGKFRRDHPNEYALLNHYFGSVAAAVDHVAGVKIARTQRTATLRDILASQYLDILREDNTYDDIAKNYGVTRAAVCQLAKSLRASVDEAGARPVTLDKSGAMAEAADTKE